MHDRVIFPGWNRGKNNPDFIQPLMAFITGTSTIVTYLSFFSSHHTKEIISAHIDSLFPIYCYQRATLSAKIAMIIYKLNGFFLL